MPDRDWIIIIILGIGWGTTFFFNEVLLREMGPLSVSFARVATAAVFCWAWVLLTGRSAWPGRHMLGPLAVMGATMFAIPFALYPIGQQYIASGVVGIVNAMTPVMVVILSHFWPGGERATPLKTLGILSGFIGLVFLTYPAFSSGDESSMFGTLVIMLAPVSYAFAMNYVRRFAAIDVPVMVAWAFSFASLLMLPLAVFMEGIPEALSPVTWASIAIIGGFLTGVSFMIAFTIMPRAGATKTSTVTFIAPISALLIGYFVLAEDLGPLHFTGMAAIFLGLFLIDGRLFRRKS